MRPRPPIGDSAVIARVRRARVLHGIFGFVLRRIVLGVVTLLPEFVVAIALVVLFGTTVFTILPAVSLIPPGDSPLSHFSTLVLPTIALVLAVTPYIARIMRASMVDVLESDFVEMARLKGMPE